MKTVSALLLALSLGTVASPLFHQPYQPVAMLAPDTVYITNSGDKYHASGCRYLRKSKIAVERKEATKLGKTACKVCKP